MIAAKIERPLNQVICAHYGHPGAMIRKSSESGYCTTCTCWFDLMTGKIWMPYDAMGGGGWRYEHGED